MWYWVIVCIRVETRPKVLTGMTHWAIDIHIPAEQENDPHPGLLIFVCSYVSVTSYLTIKYTRFVNNNKLAIPKTSLSLLSQLQLLPCLTSYLSCFLLHHLTTSKYSFIKQATLNEIYYHDSLMLTNILNLALNLRLALLKI